MGPPSPHTRGPVPYTVQSSMNPALVSPSLLHSPASAQSPTYPRTIVSPHSPASSHVNVPVVTSKPPRPYTEYTMFYQLEREFVLRKVLCSGGDQEKEIDTEDGEVALFRNDPLMPERYRDLPLRADWYISGKSKKPSKRKHRKSHGKIGFLELTRMIAARWAKVDDETKKYCKMMAAMELVKYKEDMESYNAYKERLSAIGEIPEDMKERELKKKITIENKRTKDEASSPGVKSMPKEKPIAPKEIAPRRAESVKKAKVAESTFNAEDVMDLFINSLVDDKPKAVVSPERPLKRPRTLKSEQPHVAPEEQLGGIKMAFSGIDENEIAREFSHIIPGPPPLPMGSPSSPGILMEHFDYWDALVEGTDL